MPSCTVKCRYKQLNINNDYNYALHKYLLYIKQEARVLHAAENVCVVRDA